MTLPHEIVENILSRLPIKYLFRFKSVSKKWNSTISDPTFAEIHLHQSKKSSSPVLLAWEQDECHFQGFHVTRIQDHKFRFISAIEHPWQEGMASRHYILCYCDGLYLKLSTRDKQTYFLWNPSTRTYKTLHCPYKIHFQDHNIVLYGICYDPLMKDYKVVIGDMRHYAVFSCKNNKWGEVKEMEDFSWGQGSWCRSGVHFNGSCYWALRNKVVDEFEIIRFDCRDEEMKKVAKPELRLKDKDSAYLASFGGRLCLFVVHALASPRHHEPLDISMMIMKKDDVEDSWMEFKVLSSLQLYEFFSGSFLFSINENEIVNDVYEEIVRYELCDLISDCSFRKYRLCNSHPIPYLENLFLL